jgi:hypothetical protein
MLETPGPPAELTGFWEGVITGRELASSSHIHEKPATLHVDVDGTWTMHDAGSIAVGRIAHPPADTINLEGRICTDGVGKGVRYSLQFAGHRFVAGSAHMHHAGRRVDTGIVLGARSTEERRPASRRIPDSCQLPEADQRLAH